jgi:hypothetical protein
MVFMGLLGGGASLNGRKEREREFQSINHMQYINDDI